MNYTVIARRWRPRKFEDVVGQAHIVTTLKNSIKRGRIAHAYLFAGPRGVGKTSISRILAKAVNCLQGVTAEPCNECQNCKAIDSGGLVDVIEIDAASNRGIDEIRELRETVRYLPMEGRYKVYIIDEAHMLTEPAFNALLKTLEEPPGHNIFVLATTESQKIPYTIMSRCQRFDFRRISEAQIIEQLKRICTDENITYDEKVLTYVVREADGSLRDAESILDQVIAYSGKHVTEKDVTEVIGVVEREVSFGIVKCAIGKDPKGGLELIARTLEQGHDPYQMYKGLLSFLRDMLMIKVWEGKPPFLFIDHDEYERIQGLLQGIEYYELQNMVNHMLQTEDLIRGLFPKISLEVLFINLYNLGQLRDVEQMVEQMPAPVHAPVVEAKGERIGAVATAKEPVPTRPERVAPEPVAPEPLPDDEDEPPIGFAAPPTAPQPTDFAGFLKEKSGLLFHIFGSVDIRTEDEKIVIPLDSKRSSIKNDAMIMSELKKRAVEFYGREMTIEFIDMEGQRTDTVDDYVREAELLFKS